MANHRLLLLILCVFILIPFRDPKTEVSFIDVGQGDGIYIDCGEQILIDGGSSSSKHIGEYTIEPFLLSNAVGTLNKVFITHADSDHTSGILYLAENGRIHIDSLYLPFCAADNEKYEKIRSVCRDVHYLKAGDIIPAGKGSFTCLSPDPDKTGPASDINEHSLVLLYEEGGFSALLTGDADMKNESDLLEFASSHRIRLPESVTVLKAGHHGSSTSTSPELIEAVSPRIAVLSYGAGNRYGHPHRETLDILAEHGIRHIDTARSGTVTFYTNGHFVEIKEFLNQ